MKIRAAELVRLLPVLVLTNIPIPTTQAQTDSHYNPSVALEEVTVRASKIGAALDDAPVAATQIGADTLELHRINNTQDIALEVPSLVFNAPLGYGEAYIRGIGSHFAAAGLESAVATYVDGYYLQRQQGAAGGLVDVQGITVLKGPQGTLYGRNATGGAIVISTADPTNQLGGNVAAEYGSFNQSQEKLVLNLPVTDQLAIRFAGRITHVGNYLAGLGGAPDAGESDTQYFRVKVRWAPSDQFSAIYSAEHDEETLGAPVREDLPHPYCAFCASSGLDLTGAGFYTSTVGSPTPYSHIRYTAHTLNLRYVGDEFNITSVTGYREQAVPSLYSQSYVPPAIFWGVGGEKGPNLQNDTYLRSTLNSPVNFLLGASYMREHDDFPLGLRGPLTGGLDPSFANVVYVKSISAYGDVYYERGGFKLTLGARWNQDKKQSNGTNDASALVFFQLPPSLQAWQENAVFHNVTPRAAVSYKLGDTLVYASFSRGARSGGFNSPAVAPTDPVKPETLDSYEIGAKGAFFDKRVKFDAAAFHGQYRDIQVETADATTGTIKLQNAASAKIDGIELNVQFVPLEPLHIGSGVTWLHNRFTRFPNANVFAPQPDVYYAAGGTGLNGSATENLSGTALPRAPKLSANFSTDYTVSVRDWTLTFAAIARYTGSFLFSPGGGGPLNADYQSGYTTVDATISGTLPDTKTTLSLYGTNLSAAHYYDLALTGSSGGYYIPPVPRSFGLRVRHEF